MPDRKPLTEFPDDDAPISEWCRPLSAQMVNPHAPTSNSNVIPGKSGAGRAGSLGKRKMARIQKRLKTKGLA